MEERSYIFHLFPFLSAIDTKSYVTQYANAG